MLHELLRGHELLSRTILLPLSSSGSAAKHSAEKIAKDVTHITAEIKAAKAAAIKTAALFKGSMTELVILRFFSESLSTS